jgi:hypothetical protein
MTAGAVRSVSRGVALALLALLPAYCSVEGLVTGETIAIDKRTYLHTGIAGVVTAISYGLAATALVIAATRYFTAASKRRAALFKWAWNISLVAGALFLAGRVVWAVQLHS